METVEQAPVQNMLIAVNNIKNRQHERLREKEAQKILPNLISVEDMFTQHIQAEDLDYTYEEIFRHFNDQYIKAATYCVRKYNPKHVLVNPKYFFEKYKSKES